MARRGSSSLRAGVALAVWATVLLASRALAGEQESPAAIAPAPQASARAPVPLPSAAAPAASADAARAEAAHAGVDRAVPAPLAEGREPTLAEVQAAASRLAAGTPEEDESRLARARASHWAPVLRAQVGAADTEQARAGTQAQAPLRWSQQGAATTWAVAATWDLGQVVYARDENQLALSRAQLARRRQEVAMQSAQLYAERLRRLQSSRDARGAARLEAALELLRTTAALDLLTGGLFRDALDRAQAATDLLVRPLRSAAPTATPSEEER